MAEPTTLRTFIAVPLSPEAKAYMVGVQEAVQRSLGSPGIRWVGEDARHLTLKFLGDTPARRVAVIEQAMRMSVAEPQFTLALTRLGAFPNAARPRVLWVGLGGELERLGSLYRALEDRMAEAHFPKEQRPFSPHITLGRVNDGTEPETLRHLTQVLRAPQPDAGPTFTAERLVLYQSVLRSRGAVYSELAAVELRP